MKRLLLVASPLLGPATWRPVADVLTRQGYDARTTTVEHLAADTGTGPVVVVPHSNAGLHVPHLTRDLDVVATVYVDAALPTEDATSTTLAPPAFRDFLATLADADGVLPRWTDWWPAADVAPLFPDDAGRAVVEAEQARRPLTWFDREVPVPAGWVDRPSAYLAFGMTYPAEVALARRHHWPVTVVDGAHLHTLVDPEGVAAAVVDLAERAVRA